MSREPRISDERRELMQVLVTGEQTQGRFALLEFLARAAEEPPLHAHTLEDEVIYVLRGEITIFLDGSHRSCAAGDCVLLPTGSEHTFRVESDEARLLLVLAPAGLEDYYQEIDSSIETAGSIERMIATSARYGVSIIGPGPVAARRSATVRTQISDGEELAG